MPELMILLFASGGGLVAGVVSLVAVLWLTPKAKSSELDLPPDSLAEPRQFRFRNGYLVDHSENVSFLLPSPTDHLKAWDDLQDALSEMADGIPEHFAALRNLGRAFRTTFQMGQDEATILGARSGEDFLITLAPSEAHRKALRVDQATLAALEEEKGLLARAADTATTLSWTVDGEGRVTWANAAYQDFAVRIAGPDANRGWPLVTLFPGEIDAPAGASRRKVVDQQGTPHWFELRISAPDETGLRHMHAQAMDAIIAAEDGLRAFTQTMTKTFAYLPTGLAIFDKDRTLAMFNPALMDMTGLDAAFLSRRPHLFDFFDALRDRRELPEPRDYKAWRARLTDTARVEPGGVYRERWSLPGGKTYCVTGRPQADGAVALMLEDVSADISATRAHREERDALHSALEGIDDAILVFAQDGRRLAANKAADILPEADGDLELPDTLDGCVKKLSAAFAPSPAWGDVRSFARGDATRDGAVDWSEMLRRPNGRETELKVHRLTGGGVSLTLSDLPPPVTFFEQKVRRADTVA